MPAEFHHAYLTDFLSNLGKHTGDHGFQRLLLITTWLVLQFTLLRECDHVQTFSICLLDQIILLLRKNRTGYDIVDSK